MKRFAQIIVEAGKAVQKVGCEVTNRDTQPCETPVSYTHLDVYKRQIQVYV